MVDFLKYLVRPVRAMAIVAIMSHASAYAQIPIVQARSEALGSTVTIRGWVTNGPELGSIRYVEDETAGMALFPGVGSVPDFANQVKRGDSIEVTGVLVDFNGLLELNPVLGYTVLSQGINLPAPNLLLLAEVEDETWESRLVRLEHVRFSDEGYFSANQQYQLEDAFGDSLALYVRSNHPLVGAPIPVGDVDVVAIVSDYNGVQVLPRDGADISPSGSLFFVDWVRQIDVSPTTVTMTWGTNISSSAIVRYGPPGGPVSEDTLAGMSLQHVYTLDSLLPATVYEVQVMARHPGGEIPGNTRFMSTASHLQGQVEVYFNHGVDPSFSTGPKPITTSGDEVLDVLLDAIAQAEASIDVCIYNINETAIVLALEQAVAQGVQVRLIAALATANSALNPPPSFPVLYGNKWALMHNKFVVFDDGIPEKAAVFTGSMNFTTPMIHDHPNNMLMVRDQALARAYVMEFEEMWGGFGPEPDSVQSRFGAAKKSNTPQLFRVGDDLVELYFSPSDQTNRAIIEAIDSVREEMQFALLTFTKDDLAEAIVRRVQDGQVVRGIIDNINDNGSEFAYLKAEGVDVRDDTPTRILHHKYAILDQERVITGSHNWSNAANVQNDENTLILHSPSLANQFLQEFEARWDELEPAGVHPLGSPALMEWHAGFSAGQLWIRTISVAEQTGYWMCSDPRGNTLWKTQGRIQTGTQTHLMAVPNTSSGWYVLSWVSGDRMPMHSRVLVKAD